jgi:hypothetical protein
MTTRLWYSLTAAIYLPLDKTMTAKRAYIWGPISSFSGPLIASLLHKGWHVHLPVKSALHFALSPLDLRSYAQASLEQALGGRDQYKAFQDRLRFLDTSETIKGITYDALIFCGLPPNFDESRVSRASWAVSDFMNIAKKHRGTPVFITSSLWGAIQKDGVVPEEIECERRKAKSQYEGVCQLYENKLLKGLSEQESIWYLMRLPLICGSTKNGETISFSGLYKLFENITNQTHINNSSTLKLNYNPDSTLWFLPVDVATHVFWQWLEDYNRPRICNLVSTQATLNQEWLQQLAKAIGLDSVSESQEDIYTVPKDLRSMLNDNILVKTRGLFEVMGRYQQPPTILDEKYFSRLITYAKTKNWGKVWPANTKESLETIEQMACDYFQNFLPQHIDASIFEHSIGNLGALSFYLDNNSDFSWSFKLVGNIVVCSKEITGSSVSKIIRFKMTSRTAADLIRKKISLERALLLQQLQVEGNPGIVFKALALWKQILQDHPYPNKKIASDTKDPITSK